YVLVPGKGWSEADKPGMELFDPKTDQIFVEELRKLINPNIPIEEMDAHISDPAFARRAVEVLENIIRHHRP
ncbi:MAG TPA: Tm-1-like ATP-binding domain-containing protein, partial [Thermodesulfobacteriota bacterium]|nr:Tm-1-like ATP-binding domain-containing protein [Thermodesulfobacteriota bacterium]